MKKLLLLSIVAACIMPAVSFAQSRSAEDEILSSQQLANERYILNTSGQAAIPDKVANAAFISMEGNNNSFSGRQQHTGSSQNPNIIAVMQSGNLNNVTIDQTGEGNQNSVKQTGRGNNYEGSIHGRNIQSDIIQSGNFNVVNQAVSGEELNYRITQQGNNNQVNQINNGGRNNGVEVIQQGSGMNITITNGY